MFPTEFQYEFEQEMLKHIHELKNELRERGWTQRESPEVSQTSFLSSEESDGGLLELWTFSIVLSSLR